MIAETSTPKIASKARKRKSSLSNNKEKRVNTESGMELSNYYENLSDCVFEDDSDEPTPKSISNNKQTSGYNHKPQIKKKVQPSANEETVIKMKPITDDSVSVQTVKNLLSTTLEAQYRDLIQLR